MKEVDMYNPLKHFLTQKGYAVHSEVEGVDVMAKKDDELLIVEMKTSFNLQLVYQLIERLKITDQVYAYIPLKKGGRWPKSYKRMCGLLKRLHCGLITLDQHTRKVVTVEFDPHPFTHRKNYSKKKLAVREFEGRSVDLNQGGSTQEILFTSYRENAIRIAMFLCEKGPTSARNVKESLSIENASVILKRNHMNWYERVSHGIYKIAPEFEFFRLEYGDKIDQLWR